MKPEKQTWWHVVWTTLYTWSPADARGDWQHLSEAYATLKEIEMASPLDRRWQGKANDNAIVLSPDARDIVSRSIRELADSDRVAGNTPIRALAVQPQCVHIVLACPIPLLHQKVGRLKSASAALPGIEGKSTWSRGFWWARLKNESALLGIESFVSRV